jgi:hypothetical protein
MGANMKLVVKKRDELDKEDDIPKTPEERLELVEQLRIISGKFIYDYPARLRRVIKVVRKE